MAIEDDLKDLEKELKGLSKTFSKSNKAILEGSRTSKQFNNLKKVLNRTMKQYGERVKETGSYTHEFGDALEATKEDLKDFKKGLKGLPSPMGLLAKGLKFLKDATIGVGIAMAKTALAMSDATRSVNGLQDVVELGMDELSVVGPVARELAKDLDLNVSAFSELAKTGASFGSSIVMLRKAQEEANMPLAKFTDLIAANSGTLAKLFGSVDRGIPQIVGLTDNLRTLTMSEFAKFGLTLDETSEFLGTFLELERARGNTTRMTQDELLSATRSYTKDLVTLSKLTGESVEQLDAQNRALAADGVFQSQIMDMNAKDAKTLSSSIATLPGPLQQLAKEVIGVGAPISQASMDLEAMSGGAFGEAIKKFQQDLDPVAFQNAIKTISKTTMDGSKAFGQAGLVTGSFTEALNAVVASIGEAIDPAELNKEITAAGDNIAETLNLTTGEVDKLKTELELLRFDGLKNLIMQGPKAAGGLKTLREELDAFREEGIGKLRKITDQVTAYLSGQEVPGEDDTGTKKKGGFFQSILDANPDKEGIQLFNFDRGTGGFRDFGQGTPAMLHGSEAVVPEGTALGKALQLLTDIADKPTAGDTNTTTNTNVVNNASAGNTNMLADNINTLTELNKKVENHLNKLVTIGAMTEKNTKNTNNNLANMGGSLV